MRRARRAPPRQGPGRSHLTPGAGRFHRRGAQRPGFGSCGLLRADDAGVVFVAIIGADPDILRSDAQEEISVQKQKMTCSVPVAVAAVATTTGMTFAGVRDVQIQEVNTETGVVTLFNCGDTDEPLDTWRLCTADDDQRLQYTSGGLDGFVVEAGTTFRLHFNDDAPKGDPDAVNVGDLPGRTALPLDNGPYGLCIYWQTPFGDGDNMADYIQWTDDLKNPGNDTADARAGTARDGGLWTATDAWVMTNENTTTITLTDETCRELHGPDDYEVDGGGAECPPDIDMSGDVGFNDLLAVLAAWGPCEEDCPEDIDMSGDVGFSDVLAVLAAWGPCP